MQDARRQVRYLLGSNGLEEACHLYGIHGVGVNSEPAGSLVECRFLYNGTALNSFSRAAGHIAT